MIYPAIDFNIDVEGNMLTVSSEKEEKEEKIERLKDENIIILLLLQFNFTRYSDNRKIRHRF